LVVANIIHDVLIELAEELVRLTAHGGKLILSGVLTGKQTDTIKKIFIDKGVSFTIHKQKKEWSALLFSR